MHYRETRPLFNRVKYGCKEMTWLKLETAAGFQQAEAYLVPDDMKNYRLGCL